MPVSPGSGGASPRATRGTAPAPRRGLPPRHAGDCPRARCREGLRLHNQVACATVQPSFAPIRCAKSTTDKRLYHASLMTRAMRTSFNGVQWFNSNVWKFAPNNSRTCSSSLHKIKNHQSNYWLKFKRYTQISLLVCTTACYLHVTWPGLLHWFVTFNRCSINIHVLISVVRLRNRH